MLLLVCILSTNSLIAQIKVGVSVGLNNSRVQLSEEYYKGSNFSNLMRYGIKIGGFVEFKISPKLYIQAGLNYDQKPFEQDVNFQSILPLLRLQNATLKYNLKFKPQYIEIPVNIKYVFLSKFKNKLSVIVGPYFAFGNGGEISSTSSNISSRERKKDIKFGNGKYDFLSDIDIGLNAGLEYNFNKFQLKLLYQLGLSNLIPSDQRDESLLEDQNLKNLLLDQNLKNLLIDRSIKNTNISLSFGYYIF